MESQALVISLNETQKPSDSSALIREWLLWFGVEHKEDVTLRLPLWLETFGGMDPAILERLFNRALKTCRFFPKIAEILDPMRKVEEAAVPEAAEEAWGFVLDVRRRFWNPDVRGGFYPGAPQLSERVQQSARAAGVFRDFESVEALHTWAKKRFVESFIAWGEVEQDKYLLPDGEIKRLLTGFAQSKALPAPSVDWNEVRERGEAYREETAKPPEERMSLPAPEPMSVIDFEGRAADLQRQAEIIRQKYPEPGNSAGIPPELRRAEVSA